MQRNKVLLILKREDQMLLLELFHPLDQVILSPSYKVKQQNLRNKMKLMPRRKLIKKPKIKPNRRPS